MPTLSTVASAPVLLTAPSVPPSDPPMKRRGRPPGSKNKSTVAVPAPVAVVPATPKVSKKRSVEKTETTFGVPVKTNVQPSSPPLTTDNPDGTAPDYGALRTKRALNAHEIRVGNELLQAGLTEIIDITGSHWGVYVDKKTVGQSMVDYYVENHEAQPKSFWMGGGSLIIMIGRWKS